MTGPRVYIVDSDDNTRASLQRLMESVGLPVETFTHAQAFLDLYDGEQPGCLLAQVALPDASGLELQHRLREKNFDLPIVMLSEVGDVPAAVEAMKNGAFDFVEQPFNDQHLLDCVQSALSQDRARRGAARYRNRLLARYEGLTGREKEVMHRVVQGMPNRLIAENLSVSPKTVEVHRSKVMEKMQAGSLSELISMSVTIGILSEFVETEI